MTAYFIRRFLLVPLTFVGITLMVYLILRVTPGNPVDNKLMQMQQVSAESSGANKSKQNQEVPPLIVAELTEQYRMDKGVFEGYASWLGIWPQEEKRTAVAFPAGSAEVQVMVFGTGKFITVRRDGDKLAKPPQFQDGTPLGKEWSVRIETPEDILRTWRRVLRLPADAESAVEQPYRVVVYQSKFSGLLQGNLGKSTNYNLSVWSLIVDRLPISLLFGLSSVVLIYGICIPLGIMKALKHNSWFDGISSFLVFTGYAVPGYALGALLLVWLGARLQWFPLTGITSAEFPEMSFFAQVFDVAHHAILPLLCYVVGGFAMLTMLVKNNLMDQLGSDYIRTAVAKGTSYRRAVVFHALRNSLIPVATTIGGLLSLFVSGSFLIEKIFDINGFGLLGFQSVLNRDYFVTMGILAISSLLVLVGNILSDLAVALVDPRVSYS